MGEPGEPTVPVMPAADQPGQPRPVRELLTEYLHGRNILCPSCGYNLRDVTTGICPECGTELMIHVHPRHAGARTSGLGMFGVVLGLVLCVLSSLLGLRHGLISAIPGVLLFVAAVVQLSLWDRYYRRIRLRRRDLLWVYIASGWAIPGIIVLRMFLPL